MIRFTRQHTALAVTLCGAALLAACGEKAPPAPLPPPPPPVVIVVPPKPMPPEGAGPDLAVPPVDAAGLRYSVNRNITPAQAIWNLRSAYNVAALNCNEPRHADILTNYRTFLKTNEKVLAKANKTVDAEFRGKYGSSFIAPRETYMTEVYNHYALPPTMTDFCTAVQAVGHDALLIKPAELEAFAARSLPNVEVVFDDFYRRYEQYRAALADWQARYGTEPVPASQTVQAGVATNTTASVGSGSPAS